MITVKANQSKLIPVLLNSSSSHPGVPLTGTIGSEKSAKSRDSIASLQNDKSERLENDKEGIATSRKAGLAMTEGRVDVVLAGENASVEVVGLVIGQGTDDKSIEANIVHAAPNTKSNVNVRAVLRGRSQFSFRGNVKIEKGAKGADAYLRSDALLFDDAKMGDDTPALEILEKDVKAGHAATVGKVDANMLFYLMSRGLTKNQAEKMLIEGFIEPIREKLNAKRLND